MPLSNQDRSRIFKQGHFKEGVGVYYLELEGYKIIHGDGKIHAKGLRARLGLQRKYDYIDSLRKRLEIDKDEHYALYDCLCKKDNQYFVFEIKYKTQEGRHFSSSERQISEYNRIQKAGKAQVKVLIITNKDQQIENQRIHIYDCNDFADL